MDGHVRALHQLICVYLLLLSGSASPVQDDIEQYSINRFKEKQILNGARYSNATANGVRRQGIDTSLAKYALQRLLSVHSRTGLIYNVSLAPSLHDITCQVMRLRAGSLRRRGLSFNSFHIPKGVLVHTGGPFVFLIYKSIPLNSTSLLYSLPPGYTFISPIVGIFIYTSITSTSFNVSSSEMNLFSPLNNPPISITIPIDKPYMHSIIPLCAFFGINGTFSFSNLSSSPNTCASFSLMDSALVLPPHTSLSPPPSSSPSPTTIFTKVSKEDPSRPWKVALIAVLASFFGFAIMGATVLVGMRVQDKCHKTKMLKETDHNQEILHTSVIGHTRAPTASGVRTKPALETESLRS